MHVLWFKCKLLVEVNLSQFKFAFINSGKLVN